ncbi:MAG: DUF6580 family putative transport protein [Candidatus Buchananbacteria bacterium]
MTTKNKIIISVLLVALGVACRILPHFWNFAPVAAVALFSGFYLDRRWAVINPILTMVIGDFFLGFYEWPLMLTVYACFVFVGLLGSWLKEHKSFEVVLASGIFSSVLFFLASNWAVWQFSPWYEKTVTGLINCFTLALPFYRNTLLGDLFYVGVLFGLAEIISVLNQSKILAKRSV